MTKTFSEFLTENLTVEAEDRDYIAEDVHIDIKKILSDENMTPATKNRFVGRKIRNLTKAGEESGFDSVKPKKGSSRIVYPVTEPKNIVIDGVPTQHKTVLKIAYPGMLDKFSESDELHGEHQNRIEADHYAHKSYSVLTPGDHPNEYHYNEEGVIPPLFDSHEDSHWNEMGHVQTKYTKKEFQDATKTPEFPKGLTPDLLHDTLVRITGDHGKNYVFAKTTPEESEEVFNHPVVSNMSSLIGDFGLEPVDFVKPNFGIWQHPVTGEKKVVALDFGYTKDLRDKYQRAWKNKADKKQKKFF